MKNTNIKKVDSKILRKKLEKINLLENNEKYFEIAEKFQPLAREIAKELSRRNRAAIFREACRVLNTRYLATNQFAAAAYYSDAVINGSDYFPTDTSWEICETKNGNPCIVFFD